MSRVLDRYYGRPLLYDSILNMVVVAVVFIIQNKNFYIFNFDHESNDISAIGLTVSGFILTLLSILITLKSNSILTTEKDWTNAFEIFLASDLYKTSVSILLNGVVVLVIISFINLAIGTLMKDIYKDWGLYTNIVCLLFIILTFLRCFHILSLIFKMQDNKLKE